MCKALAAGAHMVMVGRQFAGTHESAAPYVLAPYQIPVQPTYDKTMKIYRGMASREVNEEHKPGNTKISVEGASGTIFVSGAASDLLDQMDGNLRSSMSYVNAHNLEEFRSVAELRTISPAVMIESRAHGFS